MVARRTVLIALASMLCFGAAAFSVAPAALAEEACSNAASRQGPSDALPDCRVYEQVTPVNKGDSGDLFGNPAEEGNTAVVPSEDGNHLLFFSEAAFPQGGDSYFSGYVFSRGAGEWSTTSLSPGPGVRGQSASLFDPENLSEVATKNEFHQHTFFGIGISYEFGAPGGPYQAIPGGGGEEATTVPVGASADLSHIVLETKNHELGPGDTSQDEGNTGALYEMVGGQLKLINVTTSGSLISTCGATLGEEGRSSGYDVMNSAVSRDGSRIVFTAPDPEGFATYGGTEVSGPGCWNGWSGNLTQQENEAAQENAPQLYMRIGGSQTVEISAPNANAHPSGPLQPAVFVGASANGSKVFFISRGQLTADDTTHANELYEYDAEAPEGERLVRVSSGESGTAEGNVDFVGGVSSDGSAVYFEASSNLAQGATTGGLYRYDTVTKKTSYIAPEAAYPFYKGDEQFFAAGWFDGYLGSSLFGSQEGPGVPEQVGLMREAHWNVSGNGQFLVFPEEREDTGNKLYEKGNEKLMRYDAADGSLVCVSCADGTQASAPSFGAGFPASSAPPTRSMSEDGEYVFFQSKTALVTNTTEKTEHVYEWHDGKVALISSPDDPSNAYFLGSSADGSNAFIGTHAQLSAKDTDSSGDIYDARIDGGFVGLSPPICTGTGCQGVPAPAPIFATPASVTFEGVGNFDPGAPQIVAPSKTAAQIKAEKLAGALKACLSKPKAKRKSCEKSARKRYGTTAKAKAKVKKSNRRGK